MSMNKAIIIFVLVFILVLSQRSSGLSDPALPLPRMPICGEKITPEFNCDGFIHLVNAQLFEVPGEGEVELTFQFFFREALYDNELGFFIADDPSGAVNGKKPGNPGYLSAAFENATIIFPSGSNESTPDVSLPLAGGDLLIFFIIQDNTLEIFLTENPENDLSKLPLAFFSIDVLNPDGVDHFIGFRHLEDEYTQFGFEDCTGGGDLDYDDVVYNIISPLAPLIPVCPNGWWNAAYYNNLEFQGEPVRSGCDLHIDFYWGDNGPDRTMNPGNFSVRWQKNVELPKAGVYRFRAFSSGHIRLYINETEVFDWSAKPFDERSKLVELNQGPLEFKVEYVEGSQDAMVYLNWYLCRDGMQACSLGESIDNLYQTQYLDEPMPVGCTGKENNTISRYGSAITTIAMALQKHDIVTTPAELNQWLTDNDGYAGGACEPTILWDKILEFAKDPQNGGLDLAWLVPTDAVNSILSGNPVILQVAGGGHYVLAVDVIEENGLITLGINNPYHSFACETVSNSQLTPPISILHCNVGPLEYATNQLDVMTYRGEPISPFKYLQHTTQRTASLQFKIHGAEILISDQLDREVGYDPSNSKYVTQIPNSFYYDADLDPLVSSPSSLIQRTLFLPENAGGMYVMRVIGSSEGLPPGSKTDFEVGLFGMDLDFKLLKNSVSGEISLGEEKMFLVNYEPGIYLKVTPLPQLLFLPIISVDPDHRKP